MRKRTFQKLHAAGFILLGVIIFIAINPLIGGFCVIAGIAAFFTKQDIMCVPSSWNLKDQEVYMDVCFIINATGEKVTKFIASYYEAEKFVNKLRHSKKCTLVSCMKRV